MSARKHHLDGLAVGLLLACCLFWGFQQVLVKATLAEVPPVFQAAIRFAGATLLLWFWCVWRGVRLFKSDGSLLPGLLAGTLFALEFACLYVGLEFSAASRLTVFLYTAPFWVAVLLPLFVASEKLRPVQWLGLALAFAAVVFALREGLGAPPATPINGGVTCWRWPPACSGALPGHQDLGLRVSDAGLCAAVWRALAARTSYY